ncbi:MAG: hypothetical protein QNJ20_11340 [Paracoccaceae bacterium]|nr:hypothetical protein [Paracoccaceae bacterium]
MGLKNLAAKVAEYDKRLENGKASKIKPSHVEKVLEKLRNKSDELGEEIASASSPQKRARLERKLEVAMAQQERAEWLLNEIGRRDGG